MSVRQEVEGRGQAEVVRVREGLVRNAVCEGDFRSNRHRDDHSLIDVLPVDAVMQRPSIIRRSEEHVVQSLAMVLSCVAVQVLAGRVGVERGVAGDAEGVKGGGGHGGVLVGGLNGKVDSEGGPIYGTMTMKWTGERVDRLIDLCSLRRWRMTYGDRQ